ncbi:MAG: isoprenylcysteine carboxylmethyltransferase family protein [Actinobacteria bacterium]|nr:MAG: isoprenylcysteine carboxylmethyltransferase family protein [Actinomycetota bacterium]
MCRAVYTGVSIPIVNARADTLAWTLSQREGEHHMQRDWSRLDMRWMWVGAVLTGANLIGALFWQQGPTIWLAYLGGALWAAGLLLLAAPIWILKRRGDVESGRSFVETTTLVTTGLYGVVRHPQYLGWLVLACAVPFYTQEPASVALGAASVAATAWGFRRIDEWEITVFGDEYRRYAQRVPGWNPVAGVWRLARRRRA